jgi:hypothetical protein
MVVLLVVAGRTICDCELVCALATERPIPVTTINANGLSSFVEGHLLITFRFSALITFRFIAFCRSLLHLCAPTIERDRHNGRSPHSL